MSFMERCGSRKQFPHSAAVSMVDASLTLDPGESVDLDSIPTLHPFPNVIETESSGVACLILTGAFQAAQGVSSSSAWLAEPAAFSSCFSKSSFPLHSCARLFYLFTSGRPFEFWMQSFFLSFIVLCSYEPMCVCWVYLDAYAREVLHQLCGIRSLLKPFPGFCQLNSSCQVCAASVLTCWAISQISAPQCIHTF